MTTTIRTPRFVGIAALVVAIAAAPHWLYAQTDSERRQMEYERQQRGGDKRIAVLKKGEPYGVTDLFVFDIDGGHLITLSNHNCKMIRARCAKHRSTEKSLAESR